MTMLLGEGVLADGVPAFLYVCLVGRVCLFVTESCALDFEGHHFAVDCLLFLGRPV